MDLNVDLNVDVKADVKTYRAKTMREALNLVRNELGPEAAVLRTREVRPQGLRRVFDRSSEVEVVASLSHDVPSRISVAVPQVDTTSFVEQESTIIPAETSRLTAVKAAPSQLAAEDISTADVNHRIRDLQAMVEDLRRNSGGLTVPNLPDELFELFTELIEADIPEQLAREMIHRAQKELSPKELTDTRVVRDRITQYIESDIQTAGPIRVTPGTCRVVALVGPTGVGKTTTIAKLAANYRLREKHRVGLITVDTYRIAAVDQLQTYADIIDLPMEVVSTPREMRGAVERLRDMDLILMDTAGRSPRDEVKIQELKSMLAEAGADEVHLVLSSTAGANNLTHTAERFAEVGCSSLILTKLDEAASLGNLLPLLQKTKLPLGYVTNGQNVPDDIEAADPKALAQSILEMK